MHTGNNYFFLLLFGQTFIAVQNVIEWSAPALLSAVWFPPHERAVATALVGAVAPQVGVYLSELKLDIVKCVITIN